MRIQKNLDSVVTQHAGQILHPSPRLSFHCFSATLDRLAQPMPYGSAFVGGRSDGLSKTVNPLNKENPMSETKTKPIQARGGYNKKSPAENLAYANAVLSGIFTDPADYPTPPIDEATFKGAIDTLSAKITAALDGGKKALAERDHQE